MSFFFHQLRKRLAVIINRTADYAMFIGFVLIAGIGSSWYMVDTGSALTTERVGPWVTWLSAARPDADPYTRAHFARMGTLPMSTEVAQTLVSRYDDSGSRLHSSCEYVVKGHDIAGSWWSLSVFDDDGRVISNPAERYTFTSDTIALKPGGDYAVTLARDARPGNWLPTGGAGRLALVLTIVDLGLGSSEKDREEEKNPIPTIDQVACR
ncbi:MAG: DUF1214 domain-containing protein [Hyphomicrobiaceae bacterium]|nr:DUF1214 domain-containing protein [Hyphomicrobiaceae bacterium]